MKIDYVISFVDSTKDDWLKLFNAYQFENKQSKSENVKRFQNNLFFKYVFRSIEKYAPWINNVFLLVQSESQVPDWINRNTVKIVCHNQFIPEQFLPTFNSCTIECFMHLIPELENFFIYGNDDMYLFNPVKPEDFFKDFMPLNTLCRHLAANTQYSRMCVNMTNVVLNSLKIKEADDFYYTPRHIQQAFSKTIYESIYKEFKNLILNSISRFREDKNLSQYFFTDYYMLSTDQRFTQKMKIFTADLIQNFDSIVKLFEKKTDAKLVCFNNNNPDKDIILYHMFENMFKDKSKYEI